jgi:hypothetical protein
MQPSQEGRDSGPVCGSWRRAVEPALHHDPVDMAARVGRGDDRWDPQAAAGQMIEKVRFPGQACGRPSGPADDDTPGTEPCFRDRVAVLPPRTPVTSSEPHAFSTSRI